MEWATVRLRDVAEIVMGQSPPGETYNDAGDGLPFFQGKADFGDHFATPRKWCSAPSRIAQAGDILLSVRAPVGPTNVAREESCIGRGLAAIRAIPGRAHQDYLRFFMRHQEPILALQGQGSTFSAIRRAEVEGMVLPLPPLSEQRRIVEILDQADRLRRLRAEADAKADRILPALFIKMFGDPATNPMGWPRRKVAQVAKTGSGGTPATKREDFYGGAIPWVKSGELATRVVLSTEDTITEEGLRNSSAKWVEPGAILIAMYGATVGQVALLGIRATTNQAVCAIEPHTEVVSEYMSEFLRMSKPLLLSRRVGGAQPNISQQIIRDLDVPIPSLALQKRFAAEMANVESAQSNSVLVGDRLGQLFAVLLNQAFSADLTASWREGHMKELLQEMEQQAKALAHVEAGS